MYDTYIFLSYFATFIPLIILVFASWRGYLSAKLDVAALSLAEKSD